MIKEFSETFEINATVGLVVDQVPEYCYKEYTNEICMKFIDVLEKHREGKITVAAYALVKHQRGNNLAAATNQMARALEEITPQNIVLIDEVKASKQDFKEYDDHYCGDVSLEMGL